MILQLQQDELLFIDWRVPSSHCQSSEAACIAIPSQPRLFKCNLRPNTMTKSSIKLLAWKQMPPKREVHKLYGKLSTSYFKILILGCASAFSVTQIRKHPYRVSTQICKEWSRQVMVFENDSGLISCTNHHKNVPRDHQGTKIVKREGSLRFEI